MLAMFSMVSLAQPAVSPASSEIAPAAPAKPNAKNNTDPDAPEFKWDSELINLGTVAKGSDPVSGKFWFTNVGTTPLIIQKVDKTCGCTVPGWTKDPILPGERGWVEARYVSTNKEGSATKTIKVHSNAKTSLKTLTFKVKVVKQDAEPTTPVKKNSIFDMGS